MTTCIAILCLAAAGQIAPIHETFDTKPPSPAVWRLSVGPGKSFARREPRGDGQCLYLFGDHGSTTLAAVRPLPDTAYTLSFDFFQVGDEADGYEAVVNHSRPEGQSYWWLEFGFDRFNLYTVAGGNWFNRWTAGGFASDTWYHLRVRNTPKAVQVTIYDAAGKKVLARSQAIPHDDGSPGGLSFAAAGTKKGVWGMKIDNIDLAVTPIAERADYQSRSASLEAARKAVAAPDSRRLWPGGAEALAPVQAGFDALGRVSPDDWPAYVAAGRRFDTALDVLTREYREKVLLRVDRRRGDWTMVDLTPDFDAEAGRQGIKVPGTGPVCDVSGVPFLLSAFGPNCLWQDLPSRSQRAIRLGAEAKDIALLLAPKYGRIYDHDDSLVDVMQVELRYADGFRERIVPTPVGWKPALAAGIGTPPWKKGVAGAYEVVPGHAAPVDEVVMCDGALQAGWALMAMSYEAGRPKELPVITGHQTAGHVAVGPARARRRGGALVIENPSFHLALDAHRGLVTRLGGPCCGELIDAGHPSPIFAVQMGGKLYYSDDFRVVGTDIQRAAHGTTVRLRLRGPGAGGPGAAGRLDVVVTISAGDRDSLTLKAEMENTGATALAPRLIFPLFDGLDLGARPGWFFPQRGGAASDLPFEGLGSYGGMAWTQVVDAYRGGGASGGEGGGLYLRCDDTTGLYKIFALRSCPDAADKPHRVADIPEAAHPVDPWRSPTGVHLSIQYLTRDLAPGGRWSTPVNTLRLHPGDWHAAIADYRDWLKTWWHPLRPCPARYHYGFYALVGGAPGPDQRGEVFGSYDWWHLNPFWTIDYPDELKPQIAGLQKDAKRAAAWGQAVGLYVEGMVLEKSHRIAKEHGAEWAMKDDKGHYYTYYSTPSDPVWDICPAVKAWQKWDAATYAEIARRVPLCAMYVDSLGSRWAEVCYNKAHHHPTPGIWPRGCAALFESIRQAVMKVSPDTAIHSEEPGCDYMALHEDGSWSHSLWTGASADPEYNPAGLNYFHFMLPEFKMYEIPSYSQALWRCKLAFFNGEGLWTNLPDPLRRQLFIRWMPTVREHADTFMSDTTTPAAGLVQPPLYANVFDRAASGGRPAQQIVTIYNAGLRTRQADIVLHVPPGGRVVDLLAPRELKGKHGPKPGDVVLRLSVDPHEVKCLYVAPGWLTAGIEVHKLEVSLSHVPPGAHLWYALIDGEGVRRDARSGALRPGQREVSLDLAGTFGTLRGTILVRLAAPHDTYDETCVTWR